MRSRGGAASRPPRSPPAGSNRHVILYFHGGVYVLGDAAQAAGLAAQIGRRTRAEGHLSGLPARSRAPLPGRRGQRPGRLASQHAFPEQLTIAGLLRVATTTNNQE